MKNCLKKFRGVLAGCMVVVLLSTTAYGSGSDCGIQNDLESEGGMYTYCVATGEVTYTPPNETEAYSDETEGFSPGYNPFSDEENEDSFPQPYYMTDNRVKIINPQNDERCRNTVYIEATKKRFKNLRFGLYDRSECCGYLWTYVM